MQHHDEPALDDENPSREISSVGQTLKAAREALNLPIEQIAADLRIEPRYLVALEENDFESFSAPVFTKGYLKQYAIRVGLDEKGLLTDYYRQVGTQQVPKLPTNMLVSDSDQRQARWLIAGSAVALVVAAVVIWRINTAEPEVPAVISTPADDPVTLPEAVVLDAVEPQPGSAVQDATPEVVEEVVAPIAEAIEPSLEVEIIFDEDCWTEVIDGRGERLFYGLGSAGARTRFAATPPLSFFLGNASGVELFIDGAAFAIPAENRQGNLARFVIVESGD